MNVYGSSVRHKTSYFYSGSLLLFSISTDKWHDNSLCWKLTASSYTLTSTPNQIVITYWGIYNLCSWHSIIKYTQKKSHFNPFSQKLVHIKVPSFFIPFFQGTTLKNLYCSHIKTLYWWRFAFRQHKDTLICGGMIFTLSTMKVSKFVSMTMTLIIKSVDGHTYTVWWQM
jgi:hypothetical protein